MNYLDILNDDLTNKILDIVADLYEKDIEKANNKLQKVNSLVEGLNIDVDADYDKDYYINYYNYINYNNISYCMDKYLYSRYPLDNVVIIYIPKLIIYYNSQTDTITPLILKSEIIQSPIYLDILREINKIYEKQKEIFGYYNNKRFLENIIPVKESEYEYYKINPSQDSQDSQDTKINYITFECFP
jgi:hypothetical protein